MKKKANVMKSFKTVILIINFGEKFLKKAPFNFFLQKWGGGAIRKISKKHQIWGVNFPLYMYIKYPWYYHGSSLIIVTLFLCFLNSPTYVIEPEAAIIDVSSVIETSMQWFNAFSGLQCIISADLPYCTDIDECLDPRSAYNKASDCGDFAVALSS